MYSKIVAICGMPGSGKGEISNFAIQHKIPVLSMGNMVRAEAENRGLEETPGNIGLVAVSLRQQFGEQVLADRLIPFAETLVHASTPLIMIEGIRGTAEAEVFQKEWKDNFTILAIKADDGMRWERIRLRGRGEDGNRDDFVVRNLREKKWGLEDLITQADYEIINNSSLNELKQEFHVWLKSINA